VATQEKSIKPARAPYKGQSIWSDVSRLENVRTGAGIPWQDYKGAWKSKKIPLGQEKMVFDAELIGVYKTLELAKQLGYKGSLRILLDSQAALARLQHNLPGPGQMWAIQVQGIAQELIQQSGKVTIQWVPGHQGIPGNKKADQAAKVAADRAPRALDRSLILAYTIRSCTEASQVERQEWLKKTPAHRSPSAQQSYQV
jgi:hypothetical protein